MRDHRVESGRVIALMEPSEIGLLLGAETRHSLHEDTRGGHGSQTAGLLQRQEALHPPMALLTGRPMRACAPQDPIAPCFLGPVLDRRDAVV